MGTVNEFAKIPPDTLRLRIGTCRSAGLLNDAEALALLDAVSEWQAMAAIKAAVEKILPPPGAASPLAAMIADLPEPVKCLCQMDDERAGEAMESALCGAARALMAAGVVERPRAVLLVWCKPEGPKVAIADGTPYDEAAQALTVGSLEISRLMHRQGVAS